MSLVIYSKSIWYFFRYEVEWRTLRLVRIKGYRHGLPFMYWDYSMEERFYWCVKLMESRKRNKDDDDPC